MRVELNEEAAMSLAFVGVVAVLAGAGLGGCHITNKNEIEKEKEVILDEINSYLDSPSDKIFDDFDANLFGGHPLGQNILGTKESVSGFTQQDLQDYVGQYFTADNLVVSFVGNMPLSRLKAALESALAAMPLTAARRRAWPRPR